MTPTPPSAAKRMKKKSEPWEGDHGFTGMALLAWKRQRQAQLDLIEHDAWRTSTDAKERGWYVLLKVARNACVCPRTYGPGGTPEGERLVSEFAGWPAKPDLSWANLSGADLSGADLSGAYLYGADLSWADLGAWERGPDGFARRKASPKEGSG